MKNVWVTEDPTNRFRDINKSHLLSLILVLFILTVSSSLFVMESLANAAPNYTYEFSQSVNIVTEGLIVYNDSSLTTMVHSFAWNPICLGETQSRTFYIRNLLNLPATLSMTITNWSPGNADQFADVSWNRENNIIPARGVIDATFTLTVFENDTLSSFSFSTILSATG